MAKKSIFKICLYVTCLIVLFAVVKIKVADYVLTLRMFPSIDISSMNSEQKEVYKRFKKLAVKGDVESLNRMITLDEKDIILRISSSKDSYDANEKVKLETTITNVSNKDILLFKLSSETLSSLYEKDGYLTRDIALKFDMRNSTLIKTLPAGASYSSSLEIDSLGIGNNKIMATILAPSVVQIEKSDIIINYMPLAREDIVYSVKN